MQLNCVAPWGSAYPLSGANVFAGPLLEIQTGPTDFCGILELSFSLTGANNGGQVAYVAGVGVPAAKGIGTVAGSFALENTELTDSLPGTVVYTQWSRAPTAPTTFLRRMTTNNAQASSTTRGPRSPEFRVKFPQGLKMQPSTSMVLWAISFTQVAGAAPDIAVVIEN